MSKALVGLTIAPPAAPSAVATAGSPGSAAAPAGDDTIKGDWSVFLPEDAGKKLAVDSCFSCHDIARVVRLRGDASFWSDLVWSMVSNGADISRDDADSLIKYFSTNLGPDRPKLVVPVNLNSAPIEQLQMLAPIAPQAQKIVAARADKPFGSIDDLLQIDGITKDNLDKIRPFVSVQ